MPPPLAAIEIESATATPNKQNKNPSFLLLPEKQIILNVEITNKLTFIVVS